MGDVAGLGAVAPRHRRRGRRRGGRLPGLSLPALAGHRRLRERGRRRPLIGTGRYASTNDQALQAWWEYLAARANKRFDEKADPTIQLEQALTEAQAQHRRLREQAANVIASQKQTEIRLNG